jgi:hypothetical protein
MYLHVPVKDPMKFFIHLELFVSCYVQIYTSLTIEPRSELFIPVVLPNANEYLKVYRNPTVEYSMRHICTLYYILV